MDYIMDYIDREAALDIDTDVEVENEGDIDLIMRGMRIVIEHIKSLPSVTCKTCKHSYEDISGWSCSYGVCVDCTVPEDFCCAYWERRCV